MSNLEHEPGEVLLASPPASGIEILEPREVPLGGPRAMLVHRTLPQRARSLIGAWCFVDHYGPADLAETAGMVVPPHPHIGLQTVSWLFEGEIEHRDSVGSRATVTPGTLNLMTAGRGIQHSEYSTASTRMLHGVQLWVALPGGERRREPAFAATEAVAFEIGEARIQLFIGELADRSAAAAVLSPLLGAEVRIAPGARVSLPVTASFEHGVLVDQGAVTVDGVEVAPTQLAYRAPGSGSIELAAGAEGARLLLLGGEPFGEQLVMWWNFVGRDHDEIAQARADWQQRLGGADTRFDAIDDDRAPLPAPELPPVRLRPRD
ncbi:pirin family protein [Schumannella sp. 10F1B-5-1]|uniref:pirin family protein n=1 Tax=Schumannella sp. 10F1B-5-1 TaxID=2590780 RepID=UPI001130907B|nr:pirin family protein [Schumannella sp. 10F1B-5-1]TPW72948.1 pirin family protein [Schumannella sp. 10F1B-5-1]